MSWPTATLGEVSTVITGSTPKKEQGNYDGDFPFVTPGDLGKEAEILCSNTTVTDKGADSGRKVPKGTVLVCCIGATIGKVGIAGRELITNQQINSLVFDEKKVYPKFGYYFCTRIKPLLIARSSSTTMPIVNKSNFSKIEIPLPSLDEQKRIAAILDKADAIRRKRQQAIQLADDFLKSVFLDMFGDPVTNPKGWEVKPLKNVFKLSSGKGLTSKTMARDGLFPVYGGNGVTGKHSQFMFEEPQLIIGRVGVYCGAIHITSPRSWVTDNALYVKEYLEKVDIDYLSELLKLANLNQYAGKAAQPLVSGSRIYPLEMIFPPLALQEKFSEMKKKFLQIRLKKDELNNYSDDLFNSLSQKAFAGEL